MSAYSVGRGLLCTSAVAAAFTLAGMTAASAAEPITLEVWSWQIDFEETYERIFKVYEDAHPGIEVDFRGFPDTQYPAIIRAGLTGENGPDLVFLHPYGSVAPYSRAGQLVAIDEQTVPELSNFLDASLSAARIDDKLWGVPFAQQSLQIYYNKDLFDELGIAVPTKASEIEPALATIDEKGYIPFAVEGLAGANLVFYFDLLTGNTYGGKDFIESVISEEASLYTPEMVAAFQQYKDYRDYMPPYVSAVTRDDAFSLFIAGQAATYLNGSWMLGALRDQNPDFEIGVFTMPADDAGGPSPVFGYEDGSISMSAASEHPEEALELLRWIASVEFGQLFTDELKQASSVLGATPTDPVLQDMVENFQKNPVPVVWVTDLYGTTEPAPFATLGTLLSSLLVDAISPEQAAAQLEADAEEFRAQQ